MDMKGGILLKNQSPVSMIRGTTFPLKIHLTTPAGEAYTLPDGAVLRFGLKRHPEDREYLITKELTSANYEDGAYVLVLDPADTANLPFGTHKYDVGLQNGNAYTNVIECSDFRIRHNITLPEVST